MLSMKGAVVGAARAYRVASRRDLTSFANHTFCGQGFPLVRRLYLGVNANGASIASEDK